MKANVVVQPLTMILPIGRYVAIGGRQNSLLGYPVPLSIRSPELSVRTRKVGKMDTVSVPYEGKAKKRRLLLCHSNSERPRIELK